jgi:hypothetical protein
VRVGTRRGRRRRSAHKPRRGRPKQ